MQTGEYSTKDKLVFIWVSYALTQRTVLETRVVWSLCPRRRCAVSHGVVATGTEKCHDTYRNDIGLESMGISCLFTLILVSPCEFPLVTLPWP